MGYPATRPSPTSATTTPSAQWRRPGSAVSCVTFPVVSLFNSKLLRRQRYPGPAGPPAGDLPQCQPSSRQLGLRRPIVSAEVVVHTLGGPVGLPGHGIFVHAGP